MANAEVQGINIVIEDDQLDNWELLEMIQRFDNGEFGLIVDIMRTMLGVEQYEALKSAIKQNEGRISTKSMQQAFLSITQSISSVKN